MTAFYGGKKCILEWRTGSVDWCHMLDAALEPSNERLQQMLQRQLRTNRYPAHAAEVRENIVPLLVNYHRDMDARPPRGTLFLHEDLVARTLAYERDLHDWRVAELDAGRGDPGRPQYEHVFGDGLITEHRWHAATSSAGCNRLGTDGIFKSFYMRDCPGIDDPSSQNPFPIINTLLSIPFSLIHNLTRLCGMVPPTLYQQQLIIMGVEIIKLWWWDPSPDQIKKSEGITNQHDDARSPQPHPIHHPSRHGTKFSMNEIIVPSGIQTTHSSNQNMHTFELPSGQILLGTTPSFSRDGDELLLTAGDEGLAEMGDVHADKGIVTGAMTMSLPVMSEASDLQSIEGTETSDDIDAMEDVDEQPPTRLSSPDILSWCEQVAESAPEPLPRIPLIPGSFKRGAIGGMSTNDVLMIKGLIDPLQYIEFFDLSLLSSHFAHTSV